MNYFEVTITVIDDRHFVNIGMVYGIEFDEIRNCLPYLYNKIHDMYLSEGVTKLKISDLKFYNGYYGYRSYYDMNIEKTNEN